MTELIHDGEEETDLSKKLKEDIKAMGVSNAIIKNLGDAGMTRMLYHVLFGEDKAENYVIIPALSDNTEYDFEIILHKRRKKLPTQATLDILWGKLDGDREKNGDLMV